MAFPPTFDRAWDETFPPDTQLANLLGQDIRNFKTDIRERLSLLSGTLANRPSNMDAIYGGAGFGILYFATDTSQIFQWNGAAWVQAAGIGSTDYDDYTPVQFIAAAPGAIRTNTIPIGGVQQAQAVGSYIEVETSFNISAFTGTAPTYTIKINGVTVFNDPGLNVGNYYVKGVVALSNGSNPRAMFFAVDLVSPLTRQRTAAALGTTDGTVAVTIADSFSIATTISAIADFMHVRVRK